MKFESKALDKLYNCKDKAHMLAEAARGGIEVRILGSYEHSASDTDEACAMQIQLLCSLI